MTSLASIVAGTLLAAGGTAMAQSDAPGALPVDFPAQEALDAVPGQHVLGIDPHRLRDLFSGARQDASWTNFTVVEAAPWASRVTRVREETIPNALLIPLPADASAPVGSLVLTWWQSGGGMQHALVTGGTPTEPVVRYVGLAESVSDAKQEHTLGAGTFRVVGEGADLGATVRFASASGGTWGVVLNATEDALLVAQRGKRLAVVPRAEATAFPPVPDVHAGDAVLVGRKTGQVGPAVVRSAADGRVEVQLGFASKGVERIPYGRVSARTRP